MGRTYAYIRVSSKDQNEARQLQALEGLGLRREHIFLDKQSGKDFCRPQYQRLLHRLRRFFHGIFCSFQCCFFRGGILCGFFCR